MARNLSSAFDQKLDELLASLPKGQTLSCDQIAEGTGVTRNTIQKIQRRALEKMRSSKVLQSYVND